MDTIKRVQDLMQARDMNLCVLAKKCGISYSTIQTTARRGGQLSVETIERICQGLGITLKTSSIPLPVNIGAAKKPFATLENLRGERL
mgnify:CR=1 FL=1